MCIEYTSSIKSSCSAGWFVQPITEGVKCSEVCSCAYTLSIGPNLNCIDAIKVYARLCVRYEHNLYS